MTVRLSTEGTIDLIGHCYSEDAESLQQHLLDRPGASVNWSACEHLHAAVLQVLLVANTAISGRPAGAFLEEHVAPLLKASTRINDIEASG